MILIKERKVYVFSQTVILHRFINVSQFLIALINRLNKVERYRCLKKTESRWFSSSIYIFKTFKCSHWYLNLSFDINNNETALFILNSFWLLNFIFSGRSFIESENSVSSQTKTAKLLSNHNRTGNLESWILEIIAGVGLW